MTQNISNSALKTQVIRPSFDRSTLKTRIVHIGFGAFHRAHQGLYTSEMIDKTGSDWGICEIYLFGGELISKLRKQDHLYSVLEKSNDSVTAKISASVIESKHSVLDGKQAVLDKLLALSLNDDFNLIQSKK